METAQNGDFVVDTAEIAEKFGFPLEVFRRYVGLGFVKSSVERGTGADEGNFRVSLAIGNRRWVAILDAWHHVMHEEMRYVGRT
jgi:hypothetical protein